MTFKIDNAGQVNLQHSVLLKFNVFVTKHHHTDTVQYWRGLFTAPERSKRSLKILQYTVCAKVNKVVIFSSTVFNYCKLTDVPISRFGTF